MDEVSVSDFLTVIYRDQEGYLDTALIGNDRQINRHKFWKWPEDKDKIQAWADKHTEVDAYFTPRLFADKTRDRRYALETSVLYADTDEANPYSFDIQPSMVLETSPGHWQAFWCLTENVESWWAEEMSRRLTYSRVDEGSDNNGWYAGKLLRLPHAMNTKPTLDEPFRVTLEISGEVYEPQAFMDVFGVPVEGEELGIADTPLPTELPDRLELLDKIPTNPRLERALTVLDKFERSEKRWFAENELFRQGFTATEVYTVIKGSANDKYTSENRPMMDLWKEILKAEQTAKMPGAIPAHRQGFFAPETIPKERRPDLLTEEERTRLPRTFIDDYVEWASSRTNADAGYHRYAAMCILSTVFGDLGYAVPKFGRLPLNLWFMLIGPTTRSYKSTAKSLMNSVLKSMEADGYRYLLGSNATPEGLVKALSDNPDRSMILYIDEVHKTFQAARGGKSYMAGYTETLTELYDGSVTGALRASTAKNTDNSDTVFNLFTLGTPNELMRILTKEDFGSGFLPRFLYILGEPEPFEEAYKGIEQAEVVDDNYVDSAKATLLEELLRARKTWSGSSSWAGSRAVRCSPEAWDRFNKVSRNLAELARKSAYPDILEPSANRMNKMVLKLATLLAMYAGNSTVPLTYMLSAIHYAEEWYQHLATMVQKVGLTEFGVHVEEVLTYITTQGETKRPYTEVRRHFKNWTQKYWQEVLAAAQDQGYVQVTKETKTGVNYIQAV